MNLPTHCQAVNKLEKAKVIRPYAPFFGSSRASGLLYTFSRKKSVRRNSGLYKLGHGEKSVIWYWEFDVQRRYFHQFKTIDYAAAVKFYAANKFTMWEEKKGRSFRRQLGRCWRGGISMSMLPGMNARSSMRPRLMFKVRMMARMFGKTRAIPKTMTINRTMRRGNPDIHLRHWACPEKRHYRPFIVLSSVGSSTSACRTIWFEQTLFR